MADDQITVRFTVRDDYDKAFEEAVERGLLSMDRDAANFVQRYMYMHSLEGVDYFKKINTREYIS